MPQIEVLLYSTIGKETRNDRDFKGVGPGSYRPSMADKHSDPSYTIGAKVQTENSKLNVPGAGSYEQPSKLLESPGKSIGQKFEIKTLAGRFGPGPGGYNADK